MSGIDEVGSSGIPQCPDCKEHTLYWVVRAENSDSLVFLNYDKGFAKTNGEFNLEKNLATVLRRATTMKCSLCYYSAEEELMMGALAAVKMGRRRFPELVGN